MSVPDIAAQVPVLRVLRLEPDNTFTAGSALRLSDRRLLLTTHQIMNDNTGKPVARGLIRVEDIFYVYTLVASGGEVEHNDWSIVELESALPSSPLSVATDFKRALEPGTEVFLVGYHFMPLSRRDEPLTDADLRSFPKLSLPGVVIPSQKTKGYPADALCIQSVAKGSIWGASGGAVVVKDPQTGQLTAVGTIAAVFWSRSGGFFYTIASRMDDPSPIDDH